MTAVIGTSFRKIKNDIYKNYVDGFYVWTKSNLCTPDITIKYISRYLGRPVITTSRIDKNDGKNVTLHSITHATKIIKPSKSVFLLSTSSSD